MDQPPILKAKRNDQPALRDLANFVVPKVSERWYQLGLQLLDPQNEDTLHRMKKETKPFEDQCTEVFHLWLRNEKKPTWNKLIECLQSPSVKLPNVARDVEKMLDTRNVFARGKHKLKKRFSQKSQTLPTIMDNSSSYDSSDVERSNVIENDDESDEEILQASPISGRHTLPRANSMQSLQESKHIGMANFPVTYQSRSRSVSTESLPATFHLMEHDELYKEKENYKKHKHQYRGNPSEDEKNKYLKDKNEVDEPQPTLKKVDEEGFMQETEKNHEDISQQLKELKDRLNYKDMYESEMKMRIKVEDQLREADKKKLEQEIIYLKSQLKLSCEKQISNGNDLSMPQSKQTIVMFHKELNDRDEIYEKRITKVIDTFNRQLKNNEEAYKKGLLALQFNVEKLKKESEDSEAIHKKEMCSLHVKVEEFKRDQMKKLEDCRESHRKEIYNLHHKIEELKKQKAKMQEAHKKEINNLTLAVEKLKKEEIKKVEERLKEQMLVIDTLKKENKELIKQLALANKTLVNNKEFNAKFEMLKTISKEENEKLCKKLNDLQLEVDKQVSFIKEQLQLREVYKTNITKFKSGSSNKEECIKVQVKKHENYSTLVDEKISNVHFLFSNGNSSYEELDLDVLALMEKTETYTHPALSYDLQKNTIMIYCTDEKIKKGLITAYQKLSTSKKLIRFTFPIDDKQQAHIMIDEYTKAFNHSYFRYDPEKREIHCISVDIKQIENIKAKFRMTIQDFKTLNDPDMKSVTINLVEMSRKITIKLGNIVEEEVDVIVNAASNNLKHDGDVAAAINEASGDTVQRESKKLMRKYKKLSTGDAVTTTAGGILRCKFVIHAVGPVVSQHGDQCSLLLEKACTKAMEVAKSIEAISISFPPIRSNISDLPIELVANVMLLTLCSYRCDPVLLSDIRIVIIDRPTFAAFLYILYREKQNLESLSRQIMHIYSSDVTQDAYKSLSKLVTGTSTLPPPPGFPSRPASHHAPYLSYSHACRNERTM